MLEIFTFTDMEDGVSIKLKAKVAIPSPLVLVLIDFLSVLDTFKSTRTCVAGEPFG